LWERSERSDNRAEARIDPHRPTGRRAVPYSLLTAQRVLPSYYPSDCDSLAYSALCNGPSQGLPVTGEGVFQRVAEIKVQDSESIESALRRFKRKVQQEDIVKDIKKHSFYLKPGDKRRAKQALARKRSRKKVRRDSE
jgi:small subunit ribosomal protein S21